MPDYQGRREADIAAPPQACFDALTDYASMPEWQRAVRRVRVLEHGQDADSAYLDGPFRDFAARWRFADDGSGGTRATVDVHLDPGRLVPRPVARMVQDALLGRAVEDLKRRVEA